LNKLRLSRFIFDDTATLPDRVKLASAERVVFNQIHFPDTSGIMSGQVKRKFTPQTRQSLVASYQVGV